MYKTSFNTDIQYTENWTKPQYHLCTLSGFHLGGGAKGADCPPLDILCPPFEVIGVKIGNDFPVYG